MAFIKQAPSLELGKDLSGIQARELYPDSSTGTGRAPFQSTNGVLLRSVSKRRCPTRSPPVEERVAGPCVTESEKPQDRLPSQTTDRGGFDARALVNLVQRGALREHAGLNPGLTPSATMLAPGRQHRTESPNY